MCGALTWALQVCSVRFVPSRLLQKLSWLKFVYTYTVLMELTRSVPALTLSSVCSHRHLVWSLGVGSQTCKVTFGTESCHPFHSTTACYIYRPTMLYRNVISQLECRFHRVYTYLVHCLTLPYTHHNGSVPARWVSRTSWCLVSDSSVGWLASVLPIVMLRLVELDAGGIYMQCICHRSSCVISKGISSKC